MELVEDYPFGESTLSTDHLPLPPPSSFPRHTLHVHLESESKLSQIDPRDLLLAALQAGGTTSCPLLAKLQLLATDGIEQIIQLESQAFLKRSTASSTLVSIPPLRATPSSSRLTIPASTSGRSMDSMAQPQLTPLLELSEELGTLASRHPTTKSMGQSTSTYAIAGPKADWEDFSKSGFGDAPETVTKLDLQLSPKDLPLSLSRSPSKIEAPAATRSGLQVRAVREERIEIDDAFLPFVEDSQLDKFNITFSNILLVRLSVSAALELSEESTIEWLLLSVDHRPPTPLKSPHIPLRSSSPSKESTMTRKRFSLGGLTSAFRRSSSMALRPDDKKSPGSRKAVKGGLDSVGEGGSGSYEGIKPNVLRKLAVGEMGELTASTTSNPNDAAKVDLLDTVVPNARDGKDLAQGKKIEAEGSDASHMAAAVASTAPGPAATEKPSELSTAMSQAHHDITSLDPDTNGNQAPIVSTEVLSSSATNMGPGRSSNIADWHYIAEGGANLVFGYHGRLLEFRNKALRIPKTVIENDSDVPDISVLWRDELLPKLLSKGHLPDVELVPLNGNWVAGLVDHVQHIRPDFRADVDLSALRSISAPVKATLMDDLRSSVSDISHTVLAIEIKVRGLIDIYGLTADRSA